MAEQETTDDIIAEMNRVDVCADGKPCLRDYARRFDAALKREKAEWVNANAGLAKIVDIEKIGNFAALREALKHIQNLADALDLNEPNVIAILDTCRDALAEQVKNCEVGTVRAQIKRFVEYCKNHRVKITGHADTCNPKCPCRKGGDLNLCTLAWAQMPYKKGDNDGNEQ